MKIKQIKLYRVELPCVDREKGFTYGGGTFFKQDAVIVEVVCDSGKNQSHLPSCRLCQRTGVHGWQYPVE
jgi:hypothetical protein